GGKDWVGHRHNASMEPRYRDLAAITGPANLRTSSHCRAPATQPVLQRASGMASHLQPDFRPPPQDVLRRARELFPAQILGFAFVQLWDELLAHAGEIRGVADDSPDARAVCLRVAHSQWGGQPWVASLERSQKHGEAAPWQIAPGQHGSSRPGP